MLVRFSSPTADAPFLHMNCWLTFRTSICQFGSQCVIPSPYRIYHALCLCSVSLARRVRGLKSIPPKKITLRCKQACLPNKLLEFRNSALRFGFLNLSLLDTYSTVKWRSNMFRVYCCLHKSLRACEIDQNMHLPRLGAVHSISQQPATRSLWF